MTAGGSEARTDELKLRHKVDIYPGADEVPATLLARALQNTPSKVYISILECKWRTCWHEI